MEPDGSRVCAGLGSHHCRRVTHGVNPPCSPSVDKREGAPHDKQKEELLEEGKRRATVASDLEVAAVPEWPLAEEWSFPRVA